MALTIPLDYPDYEKLTEHYGPMMVCTKITGPKDRWPSWTVWGVFEVVSEKPLVTRTRQLCGSGFCPKTGRFLMMKDDEFMEQTCAD